MAKRLLPVALAGGALVGDAFGKSDGTCGYQCTQDSECGGCGTAGKCSCPDGLNVTFHEISCTCVSAPANPPSEPDTLAESGTWPAQWTADVDAWCYGDFSGKSSTAKGKFYYDATVGRTRADWTPYINGKNAHQVWVGGTASEPASTYYVQSGPLCLKFHITDPGQNHKQVGIEKPDWMAACKKAGFAHRVGREQVRVGEEDVWADHWSCRLDYAAANQSITFQNWHSLGVNSVPKGLPVRVTGGNSAPNPTKGSPRLNSVWYYNFVTGPTATKPSDFDLPNFGGRLCIPVGLKETESFFGHKVTTDHVFSPDFHRRAHFLPHATADKRDLMRARRPKPSSAFKGDSFGETMDKLNGILKRDDNLTTKECSNFSREQLSEVQRLLFDARSPDINQIYETAADTRRFAHGSLDALTTEQSKYSKLLSERPHLYSKVRDGLCHELVMWYIHHLTADAREAVKEQLVLPLLPLVQHPELTGETHADEVGLHSRYTDQVSCAICHVNNADASASIVV